MRLILFSNLDKSYFSKLNFGLPENVDIRGPCGLEEKIGKKTELILIVPCFILPIYTSIEKIYFILDVFVVYSLCAWCVQYGIFLCK